MYGNTRTCPLPYGSDEIKYVYMYLYPMYCHGYRKVKRTPGQHKVWSSFMLDPLSSAVRVLAG